MNEIHLLNVLKNEEYLKNNILSDKEYEIYNKELDKIELNRLNRELKDKCKKFKEVSENTLREITEIIIRTDRLYNILSDNDYSNYVKENSFNVKDINSQVICDITELWLEGAANFLKGNNLHLCFDTESCETPESFAETMNFTNTYFPGFDIYNPDPDLLRAYNDKMNEIGYIKTVKVYSWSLGSVGSSIQIHGETLEEFEDTLKVILSCLKPHDRKKNKQVIGQAVSVSIDVHNLAWDLEFLKYYFKDKGINHWYPKTEIDNNRSYLMLGKNEETGKIEGVTKEIKKQKNESQPVNTYSVVIGKNQVYECTWELEPMEVQVIKKNKLMNMELKRGVHFYDMVKKVPMPLSKVADLLIIDNHFKKGEGYDYKKIREDGERLSPSEVEYQYNDVLIMTKYLEQVYYNRKLKGTTASAIAFNTLLDYKYKDIQGDKYKNGFLKHFPTMTHCFENSVIRQFYRDMYNGGFTMGVKQLEGQEIEGIILSLDINSAYPYQMKYGELPYGLPYHGFGKADLNNPKLKGKNIYMQRVHYDGFIRKGPGIKNNKEGYGFIQLGDSLESSELNTKDEFIMDGFKYTARERPHTNEIDGDQEPLLINFESYWDQNTLNFMLETHDFWHYKRVKVFDKYGRMFEEQTSEIVSGVEYIDYLAFNSEVGYFGEFIDEFIARKQIGKMLVNEGLTYTSKNSMNSCSGKMGSSYTRENIDVKEHSNGLLGYEKPMFDRTYEASKEYYVPYIAFVTSYTRLRLMKIIYALESEFGFTAYPFQGCDTDSLYIKIPYGYNSNTIRKVIEYIKTLDIKIDPIELGAWDVEKVIFRYKNLGSKKMMMDYIDLKNTELDKDIKEYLKEYENNDLPLDNKGNMILKTKVTCAGLPELTRVDIAESGFSFFAKDIDYVKQIKDKCYGGYNLDYGVHNIKNSLFN